MTVSNLDMSYSAVEPVGKRWPFDGFYPAPILDMSLYFNKSYGQVLCSCVSADFYWGHLAWMKRLRFSYAKLNRLTYFSCSTACFLWEKKKKKHRAVWLRCEIKIWTDLIYIFNVNFIIWPLVSDPEVRVILKYFLEATGVFERWLLYRHTLSHLVRKVSWCPSTCC